MLLFFQLFRTLLTARDLPKVTNVHEMEVGGGEKVAQLEGADGGLVEGASKPDNFAKISHFFRNFAKSPLFSAL